MISKGIQIVITARNAMAQGVSGAVGTLKTLGKAMTGVWRGIMGPIGLIITVFYTLKTAIEKVRDAFTMARKSAEANARALRKDQIDGMIKAERDYAKAISETTEATRRAIDATNRRTEAERSALEAGMELLKQQELAALGLNDAEGRDAVKAKYDEAQAVRKLEQDYSDLIKTRGEDLQEAQRQTDIAKELKRQADEASTKRTSVANRSQIGKEDEDYASELQRLSELRVKLLDDEKKARAEAADAAQKARDKEIKAEGVAKELSALQLEQGGDNAKKAYDQRYADLMKRIEAENKALAKQLDEDLKRDKERADAYARATEQMRKDQERAADDKRKADEAELRRADERIQKIRDLAKATMAERAEAQKTEKERLAVEKAEAKRAREIFQKMTGADRKQGLIRPDGPIRRMGERDERFRGQGLGRTGDIQRVGFSMVTEEEKRWLEDYNKRSKERKELSVLEQIRDDLQANLRMG